MDASSTDACCLTESIYGGTQRLASFLAENKREVSCTSATRSVITSSRMSAALTAPQQDGDRPNFFIPGINGKARCLDGKNKPIERPTDVIIVLSKKQPEKQSSSSDDDDYSRPQQKSEVQEDARLPLRQELVRTESSYLLEQAEEEAILMQPHAPSICSRLPSIYSHTTKSSGSVGESQPEQGARWEESWHSSWTESSVASSHDWEKQQQHDVVKCPHPRRYDSERILASSRRSVASRTPLFPTTPFSAYRPHSAFQSFDKSRSMPDLTLAMRHAGIEGQGGAGAKPLFPKTIEEMGNSFSTEEDSFATNDGSSAAMVLDGWRARPSQNEEAPRWNETPSSAVMATSKSSSASKSSNATPRIEEDSSEEDSSEGGSSLPENDHPPYKQITPPPATLSPRATSDRCGASSPSTPLVSWRGRRSSCGGESSVSCASSAQITWRGPTARRNGRNGNHKQQKRRPLDRMYQSERCFQSQLESGRRNGDMDVLEKKSYSYRSWMYRSDRGPALRGMYDASICDDEDYQQDEEDGEEDDEEDCIFLDDGKDEEFSKGLDTFKSSTATTEIMDDEDSDITTAEYCSKIEEPMDLVTYARVQARREVAFAFRQLSVRRDIEKHLKVFEASKRKKVQEERPEDENHQDEPNEYGIIVQCVAPQAQAA